MLGQLRFLAAVAPLAIVGALVSGCGVDGASASESEGTKADDLVNGEVDRGHRFDVGICSGALSEETSGVGTCTRAKCSGTLIAPNLVLTAQHCVRQTQYADKYCDSVFTDAPITAFPVRVTTSDSVLVGRPIWYSVSKIMLPATRGLCHDDVALLLLSSPVSRNSVYPALIDLHRDVAKNPPSEVAIVGRGVIEETYDLKTMTSTKVDGQLRRRKLEHIPFSCASADGAPGCVMEDYSSPPSNSFTSPFSFFSIAPAALSGDSGSGVFDQKGFGFMPKLIGVTHGGTFDANGKSNHGLVTRVDIHRDLIEAGLREARAAAPSDDGN